MASEKQKSILDYKATCHHCQPVRDCYTVARVRRTIKRIAKAAMMPALGDEIINAIEAPARKARGK